MNNDMLNHIYKLLGADPYHGPMATSNGEADSGELLTQREDVRIRSGYSQYDMRLASPPYWPEALPDELKPIFHDQHLPALLRKQVD